jgi:hypothetical protein
MKMIFVLLSFLLMAARNSVRAASPPLEKLGRPCALGDTPIRWEAPMDQMQKSAAVYRVVSASFSPTIISNLLDLAGMTETNRGTPTLDDAQPGNLWFTADEGIRTLGIHPDRGYFNIHNRKIIALPGQPVEGVPDWPEALRLAEEILPKIGIAPTQLAHKRGSGELEYLKVFQSMNRFDRQQGKRVVTVIAREITLYRSFDGISSIGLGGAGGIRFNFGNHGQLAELETSWRNVEPMRRYVVATKEQFLEWLKDGKCVCDRFVPGDMQALTVKEITPYYLELRGGDPQQEIHPVAGFFGYAQLPSTNMPLMLYCPLLDYR